MRRSSVITIILLVLVIIGLSVALVVTNLPKNDNAQIEGGQEVTENVPETPKAEEPLYLALDNDIVKNMYERLNGANSDSFHYFYKGPITISDFDNEDIQTMAFFYGNLSAKAEKESPTEEHKMRSGKFSKELMDQTIKEMFGDISYTPTYGYFQDTLKGKKESALFEYEEADKMYYINSGFGGGGGLIAETAISKVEEYSDRYEVTEKMVISYRDSTAYSIYSFYGTGIRNSKWIDRITDEEINAISSIKNVYSSSENSSKIITKYYDKATEYKHTFMKNPDGTYYWVKSEIVK